MEWPLTPAVSNSNESKHKSCYLFDTLTLKCNCVYLAAFNLTFETKTNNDLNCKNQQLHESLIAEWMDGSVSMKFFQIFLGWICKESVIEWEGSAKHLLVRGGI